MIFVTGDMHGDFSRFQNPALKKLRESDVLMVCGDFGFVWDGSPKEQKLLKKIGKRKHDTVFVEGCHDNYDLLETFPKVAYRGGTARKISGNVYQLLRGECYDICGKKVFAFGGGDSSDEQEYGRFSLAEQPSEEDEQHGADTLRALRGKVDIILTHEPPAMIRRFLLMDDADTSAIHRYFDYLARQCSFDYWFFGRYHIDRVIPPRYYALFRDVYKVE